MVLAVRPKGDGSFEQVEVDKWLNGTIIEIEERRNDNKKYMDDKTKTWGIKSVEEIRFVFDFEGYKFKHYSRWLTKSVGEKSTLYKKYLTGLIPTIKPYVAVDLDKLVGLKVKVMWENIVGDRSTFQSINAIRALRELTPEEVFLSDDPLA